jgi:hypothetical protein
MCDVVTKSAIWCGAAKHPFNIQPESFEQAGHFILNVRDVGDCGVTVTPASGCERKALHWSRPARFVRPMTRSVNAEGADFHRDGI